VRKLLLFVPLLSLGFALAHSSPAAEEAPSASALFALTLTSVEGRPVALAAFAGKPLLVNFWARWCLPCRQEIPDLAALQRRYAGSELTVIGIAVEDPEQRAAVRDFATAYEMDYLALIGGVDSAVELMRLLGNRKSGLPFSVIIDRAGRIQSRKLGAMTLSEMEAALRLLR